MSKVIPGFVTYREVSITTADGTKYNVTGYIQQISIFEDIFSNTITGEAIIADGDSAKEKLKFRGNEKITIDFIEGNTKGKIEKKEFYIYASGNNIRPSVNAEVYTISFISVESVLNEHTRTYNAIEGTNAAAVQSLMEYIGTTKPFEVEGTSGTYKFVMPSWTPFEGINWYAGRSISDQTGGSYFLFYENWKGFHFKSVETLITESPAFEYRYEPAGNSPVVKDPYNIREFEVVNMGDSLQGACENYTTLWNSDLVRKKIVKQRFEYDSDNKGKLNKTLLGTSAENAFGFNLKERRDVFGSEVVVRNETRSTHTQTQGYYYDAIQPKLSAIRQFSNLKIRMLVLGDKNVMAGNVINIKMNKATGLTPKNKKDSEDTTLSGKYLITAIHKIYKLNDFHMSIEAVKDSRND